jgi:hypothetical protein
MVRYLTPTYLTIATHNSGNMQEINLVDSYKPNNGDIGSASSGYMEPTDYQLEEDLGRVVVGFTHTRIPVTARLFDGHGTGRSYTPGGLKYFRGRGRDSIDPSEINEFHCLISASEIPAV